LRYKPDDLIVKSSGSKKIRVIEIIPDQIVTKEFVVTPKIQNGHIIPDIARDILKIVVVERHRATGNVGVGFVRGFNLKAGAIGSTVAHDAHNVVVAGTNDKDILLAIRELELLQGGQIAVANGKVKAQLPLPIAGLVSDKSLSRVIQWIDDLNAAAHSLGCGLAAPFMALSFLSLSPIPALKLTDQGLIDATQLKRTRLFV
jgi:adenine deaminase